MKHLRLILSALAVFTMSLGACSSNANDQSTEENSGSENAGDNTSEGSNQEEVVDDGPDLTPAAHTHSWASTWSYDSQNHWHACSGCDEVNDKAAHSWDNGTVKTEAQAYKPGLKQFKCTICNKTKTEDIPATGGNEKVGNFTFNDTDLNTAQKIHTTNQENYLNMAKEYYSMDGTDLNRFSATGASSLTKTSWAPLSVTVSWNYTAPAGRNVTNYNLVFGQKADLSDAYQVPNAFTTNSASFPNAYLGTNYFKVIANLDDGSKEASQIKTFKVVDQAPRNLDVGNMPNCRDMGGRTTTAGGKIRQGLIYRTSGSKFNNTTPSDATAKAVLTDLLRVRTEINVANSTTNNVNLSGVTVQNCYMAYGAVPYSNLARNSVRVRQVMNILSDESNYPVFYHCRIGTDRTGITGVMINGLLGVSFNETIQDYGFSNFSPIDNQRYPGKPNDTNGDDIKKYIDEILALPGSTFQEKTYLALRLIGVPASQLDHIIDIMTEGTKANIPDTAKIAQNYSLISNGTKKTSTDFKNPAMYYEMSSSKFAGFKATTTAGKKDIVVYLGSTEEVTTSDTTLLSSVLKLRIDGKVQTITSTKNMWTAGFGSTQQDSRKGYMFNILGSYDFTAGEHTVKLIVNSGKFNVATVAVVDRAAS